MQVFLERFLLRPVSVSHLFSSFFGEEHEWSFVFVRKEKLCHNKLLDKTQELYTNVLRYYFFFQLIWKFLFYPPYFHFS